MSQLYIEKEGEFIPWNGGLVGDLQYPANIGSVLRVEELLDLGLYIPSTPDVPEGKRIASFSVQRIDGIVQFVNALEDIPPPPVPYSLTPLQARKALRAAPSAGIIPSTFDMATAVKEFVATLPEEDQEEWEFASEIWRDNWIIAVGAAFFLLTPSQVDDLFRLGATF